MQEFNKDYEVEIDGAKYVVFCDGTVEAKDGHAITVREFMRAREVARAIDKEVEDEIKKIKKYLYCETTIEFESDVKRWLLTVFYGVDQKRIFVFENLQDMLWVVKEARELCDGINARELIKALQNWTVELDPNR